MLYRGTRKTDLEVASVSGDSDSEFEVRYCILKYRTAETTMLLASHKGLPCKCYVYALVSVAAPLARQSKLLVRQFLTLVNQLPPLTSRYLSLARQVASCSKVLWWPRERDGTCSRGRFPQL